MTDDGKSYKYKNICKRKQSQTCLSYAECSDIYPISIKNESKKKSKRGRIPILDPAKNCVMARFNDVEYANFLTLYERSGVYSKATFVKARVFNESFRVVTIDKTKYEYYQKLSEMHAQFRSIGVNYNQIVKILRTNFGEKKAMSLLYKLEKQTIEMIIIQNK